MTRHRIDPLGALVTAVGAAALLWLPFVVLKPNRILPGDARSLIAVLPPSAAIACLACLTLAALAALAMSKPQVRLAAALLGVIVVAAAIATAGNLLTPPGNRVVRVAPGRIMFEIDGVAEPLAREALALGAAKLPIKTKFITRIGDA